MYIKSNTEESAHQNPSTEYRTWFCLVMFAFCIVCLLSEGQYNHCAYNKFSSKRTHNYYQLA